MAMKYYISIDDGVVLRKDPGFGSTLQTCKKRYTKKLKDIIEIQAENLRYHAKGLNEALGMIHQSKQDIETIAKLRPRDAT